MWTLLLIYVIGCTLAYVIIGYINDTEVSSAPEIAFGYVFASWFAIVMLLVLFIIDISQKMSPPTLKRKK